MKAYQPTPAITKLMARFDSELLELLREDLKNYRERNQFKNNKQVAAQQTLTAAWSIYTVQHHTYENYRALPKAGLYLFIWTGLN